MPSITVDTVIPPVNFAFVCLLEAHKYPKMFPLPLTHTLNDEKYLIF